MTRAGILTLCGKPNAGKSTLLNRLVGQKLSIVSSKPQSTRERTVGILTDNEVQIVLLDTPGLLDPQYALQRAMRRTALRALDDADLIAYLVDAHESDPPPLVQAAALTVPPRAPVLTVFNKVDTLEPDARAALEAAHPDALFISALTGDGIQVLLERVRAALPESPYLYPEDDVGSQSLRFFASEFVRETALEQLEEEVPYSVACAIEEFREDRRPVYIRAVIYVERDSQKRIVIGQGGARIREIGRASREKIEAMIDAPVYLDLWVKVLPNWRRDSNALRRLGFTHTDEESRP
jgi:GTP-binding protein Era